MNSNTNKVIATKKEIDAKFRVILDAVEGITDPWEFYNYVEERVKAFIEMNRKACFDYYTDPYTVEYYDREKYLFNRSYIESVEVLEDDCRARLKWRTPTYKEIDTWLVKELSTIITKLDRLCYPARIGFIREGINYTKTTAKDIKKIYCWGDAIIILLTNDMTIGFNIAKDPENAIKKMQRALDEGKSLEEIDKHWEDYEGTVLKLKKGFKTTYHENEIECVDDGTGVLDFVVWNQAKTIVAHIYPNDEGTWSVWLNVEDAPCGDVNYIVRRGGGYEAVHWSALNTDEESAEFETPDAALIELVKHNNI